MRSLPWLAVLLAAAAAPAMPAAAETPESGTASDPCGFARAACDSVWELYEALQDFVNAEPGHSLPGIVEAVARLEPDQGALWEFPRALDPLLAEASSPSVPAPGTGTPVPLWEPALLGRAPALPGDGPAVPLAVFVQDDLVGVELPGRVTLSGATLDGLPDPRAEVATLVEGLGTLSVTVLIPGTTHPPPAPAAEAPRQPLGVAGGGAPGRPAPPTALVREERASAPGLAAPAPGVPQATRSAAPASGLGLAAERVALAPAQAFPVVAAVAAALTLLLLLLPLYHRLQRDRLLDHATRARLYASVRAKPGLHIEDLTREAGCSRTTAVYHLRMLARSGLLQAMKGPKSVHYYPSTRPPDPDERAQRALLASPCARAVAGAVLASPGIDRRGLAGATGLSASTLSWHVGRLRRLRLIEERPLPGRRAVAMDPGPVLRSLLEPWRNPGPAPAPSAPAPAAPVAA